MDHYDLDSHGHPVYTFNLIPILLQQFAFEDDIGLQCIAICTHCFNNSDQLEIHISDPVALM